MTTIRHQNRITPSAFISTANGLASLYANTIHETDFEINKIEAIVNADRKCVNSVAYSTGLHREADATDFPHWFGAYEEGLYTINGCRFDVRVTKIDNEQIKTIVWEVDKRETENGHLGIVSLILDSVQEADILSDDYMNFYDDEESECSRCRGGGCPSCDTSGYFTGIPVSYF